MAEVKESQALPAQFQDHPRLVSNSQLVVLHVSSRQVASQNVLVLVPQCTSLQFSNISLLRSSNLLVMQQKTTRRPVLFPATSNWLSVTMRNLTSFLTTPQLHQVVSSPTFTFSSFQLRKRARKPNDNFTQFDCLIISIVHNTIISNFFFSLYF